MVYTTIRNCFKVGVIYFLFLLSSKEVYAQETDNFFSTYSLTSPIEKKIIVEREYVFTEQLYNPPFELQLIDNQAKASEMQPENAVISHFSAILQENVNWILDSQVESERTAFKNKSPEEQDKEIAAMKSLTIPILKMSKIVLMKKMSFGNEYVIIDYSLRSKEDDKIILSWSIALKREQDLWKSCTNCGGIPDNPLYFLLLNKNYSFDGAGKRIEERKAFTARPEAPFFKIKED